LISSTVHAFRTPHASSEVFTTSITPFEKKKRLNQQRTSTPIKDSDFEPS